MRPDEDLLRYARWEGVRVPPRPRPEPRPSRWRAFFARRVRMPRDERFLLDTLAERRL